MSRARRLRQPNPLRVHWRNLVGVVLIVAAAVLVGQQYQAGQEAQAMGSCQARVNAALLDALQRRDEANRAITDAQREMVSVRVDTTDMDARTDADRAYLITLDLLDLTRANNPIPQVPEC